MKDRYAWTAALVITTVSAVCAQDIWVGGGRSSRFSARFATASDFDGSFQYCRAFYTSFGRGGWRTDYPGADNNFSVRLAELTRVKVKLDETRQPHHVVVPINDPLLSHCPMVFMTDIESARLTPPEAEGLRQYLLKGGFLWVDDSWGSRAWANWVHQIGLVLPPGEFEAAKRKTMTAPGGSSGPGVADFDSLIDLIVSTIALTLSVTYLQWRR